MGQVKKMMMEFEEKISLIDHLIIILSSDVFDDLYDTQIITDLYNIQSAIRKLDPMSMSVIEFVSNLISDDIYTLSSKLDNLRNNIRLRGRMTDENNMEFNNLWQELWEKIRKIKRFLQKHNSEKQVVYNSEIYYSEQIEELQKQRNNLIQTLREFQQEQKSINGKGKEEIDRHKKEVQEKEFELQLANEQILNYKKELEEKKKQENAIVEWNNKIKATFKELSICLSPIKKEHKRLTMLFWIYSILTGVVIIFIVVLEIIICCKFKENSFFPKWQDYLVLILPIPITGALLWVFISQLNRAQRQLVVLAKHIHEIEYIEGLLLSLNSLSININDSMRRVNLAIDRLLDNHLSMGDNQSKYDEDYIVKEERRDMIPSDLVLKLLKEMKGIIVK